MYLLSVALGSRRIRAPSEEGIRRRRSTHAGYSRYHNVPGEDAGQGDPHVGFLGGLPTIKVRQWDDMFIIRARNTREGFVRVH